MASNPVEVQQTIRFDEGYELDFRPRRLRRGSRVLKLERIPLEILVLLLEHRDEIVTREQIASRVWGHGVFLDTDNSIRGAIRKLRQVLKDDAEAPRFIQTVTGQGYRFIAPVVMWKEPNLAEASTGEAPAVASTQQKSRQVLGWPVLMGMALLVLVAVTAYVVARARAAHGAGRKIKSLAVLPLKNLSGDPSQEYLADGMTEAVIGRLSMIRGLRVISRTSAMQFKETRMATPEIAKALNVDAIVEGSVSRDGNHIRVHAQLIRAATDEHFWSEEYDRDLSDVLALQSNVAQAIAEKVEVTITGQEHARVASARHVSPEVYESYLKAEFVNGNTKAEIEKSIAYFEEAISRDPTFAPAYVGLANDYNNLGTVFVGAPPNETRPKVISAARKALELDPGLGDAHVLLANVYQKQWRWADAETEYKQALQSNSNDAAAHLGFADWLMCQGRMEEALDSARRSRELDPLGDAGIKIGWILFHARRYDEAIRELRSVLSVHPDSVMGQWFLGFALIAKGHPEEAIPVLEKTASITHRSPGPIEVLATAYAGAGRRTEALRLMGELKRRRQTTYVPAGAFINAYLALGDYDQAFVGFERAYQEQSNILQFLKIHPFFDPVRGDPRFADLLHRVGLDHAR